MSLLDGLVHYYPGYEASGSLLDVHGSLDLALTGSIGSAEGPITLSRAWPDTGVAYFSAAARPWTAGSEATLSLWFYVEPDHADDHMYLLETGRATGGDEFLLHWFGAADLLFWTIASTSDALSTTAPGEWQFLVWRLYSDGHVYMNWLNDGNQSVPGTPYSFGGSAASPRFAVGDLPGADLSWRGRIAEIGIWERVLDEDELAALWNAHVGLAYPFTPPPPPVLVEPRIRSFPRSRSSRVKIVTGYTALSRMLAALDGATALDDATVHLFAEPLIVTPGVQIGDLVEVAYTSYAAIAVTPPGTWYLGPGGDVLWEFPEVVFQLEAGDDPVTVWGWWMQSEVGGTGDRIVAIQAYDAAYPLSTDLDALFVRPIVPLGQPRGDYPM